LTGPVLQTDKQRSTIRISSEDALGPKAQRVVVGHVDTLAQVRDSIGAELLLDQPEQ
jgi:hypothetical protein